MTQEEARNFLSNKKVFVKDKSKEIQLKLFEIGFGWDGGSTKETLYLTKPFLFMYKDMTLTHGDDVEYFYKDRFKEISAEDILNIKVEYLPKTWEEFCENNPINDGEVTLSMTYGTYPLTAGRTRDPEDDRYSLPSRSAAKAHRALIQLHQLRDCYRGNTLSMYWYSIIRRGESDLVVQDNNRFLSFPTRELAEEFLSNFKDLIEEAGDLI